MIGRRRLAPSGVTGLRSASSSRRSEGPTGPSPPVATGPDQGFYAGGRGGFSGVLKFFAVFRIPSAPPFAKGARRPYNSF